MNEESRARRKTSFAVALLTVTVIAVAVVGFSVANVVPTVSTAHPGGPTSAPSAAAPLALNSGPLTQVPGSSSGLSPTTATPLGTVTVVPEPNAYNPSATESVTVTLTPSQSLETLINEINDVGSPMYRHYLSAEALGIAYGSGAYASTVAYFESYGLSVQTSTTSLTLQVSGTVAEISAAFHTSLAAFAEQYQSQGVWNPTFGNESGVAGTTETGPTFYANTAPAELPQGIAAAVNGIAGLDGMMASPSVSLPVSLYPGLVPANESSATNTSTAWSHIVCEFGVIDPCDKELDSHQAISDSYFLWTNFSQYGYSCEYYNICGQYQMLFPSTLPDISGADNLWSGATTIASEPDTGQGITIAVVEVGCAIPSDLSQFSQMVYGNPNTLPERVTQIAVNTSGGYAYTGLPNTNIDNCVANGEYVGWTLETELDIEYASTMAPGAHIDVIGIPAPGYFSDFDTAYADIAQYLSLGSTGGVCAPTSTLNAASMYVVQGTTSGACGVTITSNSYGEGEEYQYFEGSPMYITAEDQELQLLNAVGVTNFFASGDSGGTYVTVNDFAAADSPGATSVGGAQITAVGDGSEFPVTKNKFMYCDGYEEWGYCYGANGTAYWAPANGVGSTAYWSYGEGLTGTYKGVVGGGFGQSLVDTQPWWQNALDTYSTGAKIDPVISGAAAFNETIYVYGTWFLFYGGTSFATPIEAGEWALIEEQANAAFGNPEMGDINPLLYAVHNAFEAGALVTNPYTPMGLGSGLDSGPVNSFTWYYYNLSIEVPSAPVQPLWFPSLANPAGSGWNYLQGLGITNVGILDNDLLGQTGIAGHALANPAFSLFLVTSEGLVPFTDPTLTAGTAYTFEVLDAAGQPGIYDVQEYSGQSNAGAYGGGTTTTIQTGSNGQFTYTPMTGTPPGGDAATTYAYFLVTSLVGGNPEWSFVDYAVQAPTPQGTLTLCVVNPYGGCDSGLAETTMFTTTNVGFYQIFGQSDVWLNGLPVSGAVVTQVAVFTQYGELDPTLPPADYAPGTTIGQTLSDARGEATFWTDALVAEHNGSLYTDVYQLTATYDGLVSNTVTVFVEPQSGSFYTGDLTLTSGGGSGGTGGPDGAVVGNLSFAGMKYASFVNISVGSAPGQYVNYTCPLPAGAAQPPNTVPLPGCSPFYDTNFGADVWESGVDNGLLPVDLTTAGLTGPIVVSELAGGVNDLTFGYCESFDGFSYCFSEQSVQHPIVWQDPTVFLPATISQSATTGEVTGSDTIAWSGTAYPGAVGSLSLVSAAGSTVLATGISGSYALDTTALLDGYYSVVFTETAPGAATIVRSVSLYADNEAASLSTLVSQLQAQLTADQATISTLQSTVVSLEAGWSAANQTIASDQAQITSLDGQIATLTSQLSSAQASVISLTAQVQVLTAQITQISESENSTSAEAALLVMLEGDLNTANGTIAKDVALIGSLQSTVSELQSELNAKKNSIAPAWYDTFPGGGLGVAVLFAAIGAIVGGVGVGVWSRRRRGSVSSLSGPTARETALPGAEENAAVVKPRRTMRSPEGVIRLTRVTPVEIPAGVLWEREEPNPMYR